MYHLAIDLELWDIIQNLYEGVTSTVKWQGETIISFNISQDVRQGGVISSHLYKQYINELLANLEKHRVGISLGSTFVGCLSCADDILLISNDNSEMQEMLDTVHNYAGDHRFQIHPVKSNTITKSPSKQKSAIIKEKLNTFQLGNTIMKFESETTHLGLKRAISEESKIYINNKISLARRTLYSVIKTGVHGTNGLNPRTSCKIYQVYVLPRLLYGLETLNLQTKDIDNLRSFHLGTLKQLQSLPNRTARCAVYLIISILPIIGELHKKQLGLLYSVAMSNNNSIREIAFRQNIAGKSTIKLLHQITDILNMYNLPSFLEIMNCQFSKVYGKKIPKNAINTYWQSNQLKEECYEQSTLNNNK